MAVHTMTDLIQMQSLPLEVKVRMTAQRADRWVDEFGEEGVYVSFSGGKDSTVLQDIIRNVCGYKKIPSVFVDVPTQYPELKQFATSFENVEVLKPKISFMDVCERYGFPLISKEVSGAVYDAKRYLTRVLESAESLQTDRQTDRQTDEIVHGFWACADVVGIPRRGKFAESENYLNLKKGIIPDDVLQRITPREIYEKYKDVITPPVRAQMMYGEVRHKEKGVLTDEYSKKYDKSKYEFFLQAPFDISDRCCKVMKKAPVHQYAKDTGRMPMTAQMADESELRKSNWLKYGCNGFNMKSPISNPMSFWTEQDVLQYIKTRNLPICSVYGDVVIDYEKMGELQGQSFLFETGNEPLRTTGCERTGCVLCGFGCHLEKPGEGRFEMLKQTHPKYYALLDVCKNNGITYREAIEWLNEHGDLNIRL